MKLLVEVLICPHCNHIDDLAPHPRTGESQRCPCPHDEVTAQIRAHDVQRRHRAAVARARERQRWAAWVERNVS